MTKHSFRPDLSGPYLATDPATGLTSLHVSDGRNDFLICRFEDRTLSGDDGVEEARANAELVLTALEARRHKRADLCDIGQLHGFTETPEGREILCEVIAKLGPEGALTAETSAAIAAEQRARHASDLSRSTK